MKSIYKISAFLFILCLTFFACTEEAEYSEAEYPTNAQVYFPNTLNSKVELSQSETSFNIELKRIDTKDAISVAISVTNENPTIFVVPSSVNFAAGADHAALTITYDPSKLTYDDFKSIVLNLSDAAVTTVYGNSKYEFQAGIPAPWESLGKASFTDAYIGVSGEVELQHHMLDPVRYRLISPYKAGENLEFSILPKGSVYKNVTTTVDNLVVYNSFYTYYNTNYSANVNGMHPSSFTALATESFWLHNTVIQMSSSLAVEAIQLAPYYYITGLGGWNYTQSDGIITVVFPGAVLADYSSRIEYTGRYTDTAGQDYAIAKVALGEDVEYAKVALVKGTDINSALAGIINGSIASEKIETGGEVRLPCTVSGKYTYVVVTFNAEDEDKDYDYTSFDFIVSQP